MKKYLMILSTIIGVETVTTLISNQEPNSKANLDATKQEIKTSLDISNYDLTNNPTQELQLNNLLNLIKNINQEQKETQRKLTFSRIPRWNIISDFNKIFALGWFVEGFKNLENLLNSEFVQFENVWMFLSKEDITLFLDYKIADINQTIKLFYFEDNFDKIPLKQEQMKTGVEIAYEYEF